MLVDIAYVARVDVGQDIKKMVLDVVARVKSVRNYAVSVLEKVLRDDDLREKIGDDNESADGLIEAAVWVCGEYPSELSSPLSAISNLLSPSTSTTITSLSVQAVAKIFGYYCTIAASSWSGDKFEEIKALVASIGRGLAEVERDAKGDMEVLERIGEIKGLLGFVKADLEHHVPPQSMIRRDSESSIPELEGGFEAEAKQTNQDEPPYPKSLYIFPPLSTSHPLNAVASYAQSSIPVPDGLDLDTDLVPGGGWPEDIEEVDESEEEREKDGLDLGEGGGEGMEELRRVMREGRKKKKGKKGEEGEDKVEKMRVSPNRMDQGTLLMMSGSGRQRDGQNIKMIHIISMTKRMRTWITSRLSSLTILSCQVSGLYTSYLLGLTQYLSSRYFRSIISVKI